MFLLMFLHLVKVTTDYLLLETWLSYLFLSYLYFVGGGGRNWADMNSTLYKYKTIVGVYPWMNHKYEYHNLLSCRNVLKITNTTSPLPQILVKIVCSKSVKMIIRDLIVTSIENHWITTHLNTRFPELPCHKAH